MINTCLSMMIIDYRQVSCYWPVPLFHRYLIKPEIPAKPEYLQAPSNNNWPYSNSCLQDNNSKALNVLRDIRCRSPTKTP